MTTKEQVSGRLQRFILSPGVWTDRLWVGGNIHYTWIEEPITITPTEVTITIHDDARWSDGHKITAKDIAVYPILQSLNKRFPPFYATEEQKKPDNIFGSFDDIEITDRSVTYRSSAGYFDAFWDWTIRTRFGIWGQQSDAVVPTHIEPYGEFADAVIETAKRAQKGEINPWEGRDDPLKESDDPHQESLIERHLAKGGEYVAKFSQPKNVISTGAWDLVEMKGSQDFLFEKNSHHRNVDTINFDSMVLEYTPSADRERAALKADRLDYGAPGPTPQSVVESLPTNITQLRIPGGIYTGNELGLNFDHQALGNRAVRAAIMYALDHQAIAKNVHQSAAEPVDTPGGDCWDATDYVSQEWIDKDLITYSTNREKATTLMRKAGYSLEEGQWIGANGEPLALTIGTQSNTPRWEPTVASQLSQFGIPTSVKTFNTTTFSNRVSNGELPLWSHWGNTTNKAPVTLHIWYEAVRTPKKYGIYPQEQFATGKYSRNLLPTPRTEERWSVFTIQAPPVGQANGSLQEYHPAALALLFFNNPPEAEFRRRMKIGLWLANWFLPTIPINKTMEQHFIDDVHWQWPTDTPLWKTFTSGGPKLSEGVFASGTIRANPDNPEQG